MYSSPLFSVLIANYNNGPYIKDALDSVMAQTYSNWEIILVDDCSTDNSKEILDSFGDDSRIKVYYNEQNRGCGYTKRRCAALADGEICGFLDADDVLLPDAIAKHVETHLDNEKIACLFSRYYFCDKDLNILSESRLLQIPEGESYFTHKDYSPEHFTTFKTIYYKQTEGIAPDLKKGVDQDLYFKLEEVSDIMVLNHITYKYRFHSHSISYSYYDAFYWNLIVRHRACLRRGLDPERYPVQDFLRLMNSILNSRSYKLGKALTRPFSRLLRR